MDLEGEEEADLDVDLTAEGVVEVTLAEEAILAVAEGENMAVAEGTSVDEVEIGTMTGEAAEEGDMTVDRGAGRHRGVYLALIREAGVHRDESRNGMNRRVKWVKQRKKTKNE